METSSLVLQLPPSGLQPYHAVVPVQMRLSLGYKLWQLNKNTP